MFWRMGLLSIQEFYKAFQSTPDISLSMTVEVLNKRKQLTIAIEQLRWKIQFGLRKLEEIRVEEMEIRKHEADIMAGKKFQYTVRQTQRKEVSLEGTGQFVTNCLQCNYTCHYPCIIADDQQKFSCYIMYVDLDAIGEHIGFPNLKTAYDNRKPPCKCSVTIGELQCCTCWESSEDQAMVEAVRKATDYDNKLEKAYTKCTICPTNCSWDKHKNYPYKIEMIEVDVIQTNEDLKRKYDKGVAGKNKVEAMLANLEKCFADCYSEVIAIIYQVIIVSS